MGEHRKIGGFVLLAVALTGAFLGVRVIAEAGESGGIGDPSDASMVDAGHQLYLTSCVSCHGVSGIGTVNGPNIQNAGQAGANFMLQTGRMPMAAPSPQPPDKPKAYSQQEIRQLVAYVASLGNGPKSPPIDTSQGNLQKGSKLYLSFCAACHNSSAIGGAISDGRYAPSLQETAAQQVGEAPRVGPGEMPTFDASVLPDKDLNDIATYVEYLHKPHDPGGANLGYAGPVAEGFVALLVGLGVLIIVIRWITRESGAGSVREAQGKVPVLAPHVQAARDAHPATVGASEEDSDG